MSKSTDGILCYGICLSDEETFENMKNRQMYLEDADDEENEIDECKLNRFLEKEFNVNLVMHCSCDYPMYILAPIVSVVIADRGYPEPISNLKVYEDWEKNLRAACDFLGVDFQTPGWWLASLWC